MSLARLLVGIALLHFHASLALAQAPPPPLRSFFVVAGEADVNAAAAGGDREGARGALPETHATPRQVELRSWGIVTGSAVTVGTYGHFKWWTGRYSTDFRTVNEGWFGQDTYAGGADKAGHFFSNYVGTRLFVKAFEWAGKDHDAALLWAACTTLGLFTGVEVVDGFSERWRFSKEDVIMNAIGIGTAFLFEKYPSIDRLLDLRLLYKPTNEFDPFGDYSGQTYLVVAKASGIGALGRIPLVRYLEVAAGYGTRGYKEYKAGGADYRSRNLYFGGSLNLSEFLNDTVFRGTWKGGRAQRATDTALEYVQIPGTILLKSNPIR